MEDVRNWLRGGGLEQYAEKFEEEGWDDLEVLFHIKEEELKTCISKVGHRRKFYLRMQKTLSEDRATSYGDTDDDITRSSVIFENLADSAMTSEPTTDTKENTETINSDEDAECNELQRAFDLRTVVTEERISWQLVPSTRIILGNSDFSGIFNNCTSGTEESIGRKECFRQQMQTVIKAAEEKDELYVETRAFEELVQIINYSHMAVIIGIPGDGKSAMAYHLSLKYNKKGFEHIELHFAREWKDHVDGSSGKDTGTKQFVLIDDIFGRLSVDETKLSEWTSLFGLMQKVVEQRDGDLIVVCTCRKYVFMDAKPKLTSYSLFQGTKLVDMTSERFSLAKKEKQSIWNNYSKKYNVNISVINFINKEGNTPHGFPHCVELFCNNRLLQMEGCSFFENPMKYVEEQITYFIHSDRIKFCVLLLVLLHENKFSKPLLDLLSNSEKFRSICDSAGLAYQPHKIDVKQALQSLKGTYITEFDSYYKLSHDSLRENLALLFIKENTNQAIHELDFFYLTDHIRCVGQKDGPDKMVYILPPEKNSELIKRMMNEIKTGNAVAVAAHSAWESIPFVEEFMECAFQTGDNGSEQTCIDPRSIFNTKDNSASCIFYFNLLDALNFLKRTTAYTYMLENKGLKNIMQDVMINATDVPRDRSIFTELCTVMDSLGSEEEVRMLQMNSAISMEILDTLCTKLADREFSCYIFGSQAEGTHVPTNICNEGPSVSYLTCLEGCEVIHDVSEVRANQLVDLLIISDEINAPGYVKLQVVLDGVRLTAENIVGEKLPENTKLDYKDRVCVYRKHPDQIRVDVNTGQETTTNIITGDTVDICHSYRCRTWPDIAKRWQNRVRYHNWPSPFELEQMKSLGIFLVPVGCHDSIEKHLEWKMCFLLQERQLMRSLNQTQHHCYILLKIINNDIVSFFIKDNALVSYHLKTCLFYVIENTASDIWVPEKLLYCVKQCLNCILKRTIKGHCPNYFIDEENMFSRRIHGELQTKLRNILELLLSSDFEYLLQIKCGNIGLWIKQAITGKPEHMKLERVLAPDNINMYLKTVRFIVLVKDRILSKCYHNDLQTCVRNHLSTVVKLKQTENITEHSKEETKNSISLVLPYVELSFMNNLVAYAERFGEKELLEKVLFSRRWHEISVISNSFSARLKQATYLHILGFPAASLQILEQLVMSLKQAMISICGCRNFHVPSVDDKSREYLMERSEEEFRIQHCMPCLVFLPTEIVPNAIRMMMKRLDEPKGDFPSRFGYNWVVLDSKVLLHYLLYLNHTTLGRAEEASKDTYSLINVLETDTNLGHKDTGFNILSWIFRDQGNEQRAEKCYQQSLQEQEKYTAVVSQ